MCLVIFFPNLSSTWKIFLPYHCRSVPGKNLYHKAPNSSETDMRDAAERNGTFPYPWITSKLSLNIPVGLSCSNRTLFRMLNWQRLHIIVFLVLLNIFRVHDAFHDAISTPLPFPPPPDVREASSVGSITLGSCGGHGHSPHPRNKKWVLLNQTVPALPWRKSLISCTWPWYGHSPGFSYLLPLHRASFVCCLLLCDWYIHGSRGHTDDDNDDEEEEEDEY